MEVLATRGGGRVPELATHEDRASLAGRTAVVVADGIVVAYGPVAAALGCPVGEVPARYDDLISACRLGDVVAAVGPLTVGVDDLAATMIAAENRPMHDNNCRLADAADRRALAEATLARWSTLLAS